MCLFCIEIQKQNMTNRELARAYREFEIPVGHEDELHAVISENYDRDEIADELAEIEIKEHYEQTKERKQ